MIAIIAIIILIGTVAYGAIQEGVKVRSDKATCAEIGKALTVREADLDKSKGIALYPTVVRYDDLEEVEHYVKKGLIPQSMPDGTYIVTAIQTQTGKKIIVGIGKDGQEISNSVYRNRNHAGWAWSEEKEIKEFIKENNQIFSTAQTIEGLTEEEDSSIVAIMENSDVAVGSYIDYTGGSYTGKWVVLRNNGGTIEIISKESVGDLTLSGADAYINYVKILNDECKAYVNSKYASKGRCLGATSSSLDQVDTSQYPLTFAAARERIFPYHDTYYTSDQTIIQSNSALKHSTGYVWVASRFLQPGNGCSVFNACRMYKNGSTADWAALYRAYNDNSTADASGTYGLRPVITLKSRIKIVGGSGTSDVPYTIGI